MTNETQQHAYPEGGLTLMELWQILSRRRLLIFVCIVVFLAASAAVALFTPPVYEASVKLRIGQLADSGLLEAADDLSSRTLAQFGEDVADGVKRERPFLTRANPQKGVPSTVELVAEGGTAEDAAGLLTRVVHGIQATHDAILQRNVKFINERLDSLAAERSALQQQFRDANALLDQLKRENAVQASFIMLELGRISNSIRELEAERPALSQKLERPQTRPTELLGEIVTPARPASPKIVLLVALSAVIGLASGVVLSFLIEFAANARRAAVTTEA